MPLPRFNFTSYSSSFKVVVDNLESLTVEQIEEIERFVSQRKGVFDFNTYSFSIQKRVSFREFKELVEQLGMKTICVESSLIEKREARISFGQYKGMAYSKLPDSYLQWLKSNHIGKDRAHIEKECKKRAL